jgi:Bacteriophage lambda head decoration protein D
MSLVPSSGVDNAQVPGVTAEVYLPDQLIAGRFPLVTDTVTLISGQNLSRGAVLGQITASGKYTLSLSAASDGSQTPVAVLADTGNASGGDISVGIYRTGEFNANALSFGTGHSATTAATLTALRDVSIFVKSAVSAADPS